MSMKRIIGIIVSVLLLAMILAFSAGCNVGGTNIRLKGVSLGAVTMDGEAIQGLPSDKINLLLEVSAREITIEYATNSTILTLNQSGATLEMTASGIIIKGMKPEQMKVEWVVSQQD